MVEPPVKGFLALERCRVIMPWRVRARVRMEAITVGRTGLVWLGF